ncbi:MAG: hypothetical protein COV46_03180 [Deltaproteobacteria bacterium CG11_big_fil_rev_8_21_14_0_20_49_13]|nr:MAG: hypothetical protein COV46_03180 [Deltaproteobacteria bacterium CG11_big_fil_rev_8_21_14_0_20_49_13]
MQRPEKLRYILYARKSSESGDRQVQSIDDQINRLQKLAGDLKLNVVDILIEAKSAKKPQSRPIFMKMMQRIEAGEADGILAWQLNRLSRNPVDSGTLGWFLQQGTIQSIQTTEREYLPDDNVLLFSVESGMANQYILELRKNVKRGVDSKLAKGWKPNVASLGYLNEKEEKTIVEDPERFPLIRKMWDLMLTGTKSPPQILEIANKQWGFRTRKTKRLGGKELSRSGIYRIFTNPFYAGIIAYGGKEYDGKHKAMITLSEFDRVQYLLGRKGKARPKTHAFAFTGLIRCGECGCVYTAETKRKLIKCNGEVKEYTYYHCTRKRTDYDCSQKKVIRDDVLNQLIADEIEKFTILPEFRDWALEVLKEQNSKEVTDRNQIFESQTKALAQSHDKLDRLVDMRLNDLLSNAEYVQKKDRLEKEIQDLRKQAKETEERIDNWLELTEKVFDFATNAHTAFLNGNMETKKQILMALGSNPTLKDGKLSITASEWLVPIEKAYPSLEAAYQGLEPAQTPENTKRMGQIGAIRSTWRRGWDSNPRTP